MSMCVCKIATDAIRKLSRKLTIVVVIIVVIISVITIVVMQLLLNYKELFKWIFASGLS